MKELCPELSEWGTDPFHADSPRFRTFLLKKETILTLSDTPLKVGFPGKLYKKFGFTLERRSLTSAGKF
jgi:hypothetical protein